jgi:predicted MPP superfamily phosphohydrolase
MTGLSRRSFLKIALASTALTSTVGVSGVVYAHEIEPRSVEVKQVRLTLPRLAREFHGYRLVQISDIHMGTWMTREHLQGIVRLVNAQEPDVIAVTGDFVTVEPVEIWIEELLPPLRELSARDGTLAILGNHDHWTNPQVVRAMIPTAGMIDLNNAVYTLQRGEAVLHFAGVDDYWERKADLESVLNQLPDDGAAVLLAHEPDFADISAASGRFDLQLSGHSHGGQVILPFIGPPVLPTYGRKYPVGLYQVGDMIQYTNRGVGMVGPYVRFNCRPEITVFTLESAQF